MAVTSTMGSAHEEPCHVEVVDHHVPEQAAGPFDVRHRRRGRIARGDLHEFDGSDAAAVDLVAQTPERGVEPAIESDHQRNPAPDRRGDAPFRPGQIEIDGFLAEDRFAGRGGLFDLISVQVGGRCDEDAFDGRIAQHLLG